MAYDSLADAMDANDELTEARTRYRLLAEAFEEHPRLRPSLSRPLDRAKAEIVRLLAAQAPPAQAASPLSGKVVAFDAGRFRKSAGQGK